MKFILRHATIAMLLGWQGASAWAQTCHAYITRTRPDNRYEAVANANPAGSEVRDKVTGLIWQRCVQGMAWNGTTCTGTASRHSWSQALELARNVPPSKVTTGAAAVWRLPNHAELFSLVELACYSPAINITFFPETPSTYLWSSSPSTVQNSTYAWSVDFDLGFVAVTQHNWTGNREDNLPVRMVRSGQ